MVFQSEALLGKVLLFQGFERKGRRKYLCKGSGSQHGLIQALKEQLVQSLLISGKGVFYLDSNKWNSNLDHLAE